jgi:hypothetical protein
VVNDQRAVINAVMTTVIARMRVFENKMSIWLRNGAGGVRLDKEGKILKFSLSIIHGSREGLSFAATHPRKLLD